LNPLIDHIARRRRVAPGSDFAIIVEMAEALREFRRRYNEQWLIERHGFRTPYQIRRDFAIRNEQWLIERHGFRTPYQIRRDFAIRVAPVA
jgi:hypothetical protein